jgi:hypothetical protein
MKTRVWYHQLDIYDAIRRMASLLSVWDSPVLSVERLFIADYFTANPSMLHRASMPSEVRKRFLALSIARPEKLFVALPAPTLLFHKMSPIQNVAFKAMIGKGFVDTERYKEAEIILSGRGRDFLSQTVLADNEILLFIISYLGASELNTNATLRQRTGLRRGGL